MQSIRLRFFFQKKNQPSLFCLTFFIFLLASAYRVFYKSSPQEKRDKQLNFFVKKAAVVMACGLLCSPASAREQNQSDRLTGPYVGAGLSVGATVSQHKVDTGIRIPNFARTLSYENVSPSSQVELRLGWGTLAGSNFYLGLETEGLFPLQSRVENSLSNVQYNTLFGPELAAYGRLGWTPDGGTLLFVRAGAINLNRYVEAPKYGYSSKSDAGWAPIIGLGVEIPIYEKSFFRIDLSHADAGGKTEMKTYQASIGLGYRF